MLSRCKGSVNFKFGVLFAKDGQLTDDEMFSNGEHPLCTPAKGNPTSDCPSHHGNQMSAWVGISNTRRQFAEFYKVVLDQLQSSAKYFTDHLTLTSLCSGPWRTQPGVVGNTHEFRKSGSTECKIFPWCFWLSEYKDSILFLYLCLSCYNPVYH